MSAAHPSIHSSIHPSIHPSIHRPTYALASAWESGAGPGLLRSTSRRRKDVEHSVYFRRPTAFRRSCRRRPGHVATVRFVLFSRTGLGISTSLTIAPFRSLDGAVELYVQSHVRPPSVPRRKRSSVGARSDRMDSLNGLSPRLRLLSTLARVRSTM
jgi:hypothetical protein